VGNIYSCTDETKLEDDEDVDKLDPSKDEEARPRKKQKKRPSDVKEDPPDLEITAYIFIIIPPPPTIHVCGKSAKPPVEQHHKRPPFIFDINISYEDFISKVASATPCYPNALTGMMWKFKKLMKGNTQPLTTKISYTAMIKQLCEKTKDHVINIYMPPPQKLDEWPTFVCNWRVRGWWSANTLYRNGTQAKMTKSLRVTLSMMSLPMVEAHPCWCKPKWYVIGLIGVRALIQFDCSRIALMVLLHQTESC
jgi:hypothetical protein